jgi:predicted nucleic acid-binding protein
VSAAAIPSPLYVDTSVLVAALAPDDRNHLAARTRLAEATGLVTSALAEVEVGRALRRRGASTAVHMVAGRLLAGCELVDLTEDIRRRAIAIAPTSVRSLEAVHVATAVVAGVTEFASYDMRQRVAAEEAGLEVVADETR